MARRKLKPKQEATIERMKENRINDGITLRKNIEDKLKWSIDFKKKGLEIIEKQIAQIKENQNNMIKIDAIITVLSELLEPKIKDTTEEPKKE